MWLQNALGTQSAGKKERSLSRSSSEHGVVFHRLVSKPVKMVKESDGPWIVGFLHRPWRRGWGLGAGENGCDGVSSKRQERALVLHTPARLLASHVLWKLGDVNHRHSWLYGPHLSLKMANGTVRACVHSFQRGAGVAKFSWPVSVTAGVTCDGKRLRHQ